MPKTDVIFCGLIRKKTTTSWTTHIPPVCHVKRIQCSIDVLQKLRNKNIVDNIIISCWKDSVPPELKAWADKNQVHVIEADYPPGDPGPGHLLYQMKAQENGMKLCNKDNFVFKTRADLYLGKNLLETLFSDPEKFLEKKQSSIFEYRIWVPWTEIATPFYLADECIYGCYNDMHKLVHYDQSYNQHWSPHVIRFIHNFLEKYPYLKKYIDHENAYIEQYKVFRLSEDKTKLEELRIKHFFDRLKDDRIYYFASYYLALYREFRIFSIGGDEVNFKGHKYVKRWDLIDNEKFTENFTAERMRWRRRFMLYDDTWVKNLVEGKMNHDPIAHRLHSVIQELIPNNPES